VCKDGEGGPPRSRERRLPYWSTTIRTSGRSPAQRFGALGYHTAPDAAPILRRIAQRDPHATVRASAKDALVRIGAACEG